MQLQNPQTQEVKLTILLTITMLHQHYRIATASTSLLFRVIESQDNDENALRISEWALLYTVRNKDPCSLTKVTYQTKIYIGITFLYLLKAESGLIFQLMHIVSVKYRKKKTKCSTRFYLVVHLRVFIKVYLLYPHFHEK